MEFPVHGAIHIRTEGQIVVATIDGPWNLELIALYRARIAEHLPRLAEAGPWAVIIELRRAALCPPEAIEAIRQGVREHARNWHRTCTSYVIAPEVMGHHVMDRIWREIYAEVMPFEIFEQLDAALQWCQQHLAEAASGHPDGDRMSAAAPDK